MFSELLTIKGFIPVFKETEEASNIHVVTFEENDFTVVAQKKLYNPGDKALYVYPDCNIPDTEFWAEYHAPDGNPNKSRLGSNGRVIGVKFGWKYADGTKVFSNGILLPLSAIPQLEPGQTYDEVLGIFKQESDETGVKNKNKKHQSGFKGYNVVDKPEFIRKSDEEHLQKEINRLGFPVALTISLKIDGSSIAMYYLSSSVKGICSRRNERLLDVCVRKYEGFIKKYNPETQSEQMFQIETRSFISAEEFEAMNVPFTETIVEDEWTLMGRGVLSDLVAYGRPLAVRGEIYGGGLNHNPINPHSKLPLNYAVYGIDDMSTGVTIPLPQDEAMELARTLGFNTVPEFCRNRVFESKKELMNFLAEIVNTQEHPIEGVVIRSSKTNDFSCKWINPEYDEKKK